MRACILGHFSRVWLFVISVCVSVCVLVAQLCLILCDPMDCSLPGSSVCGILQARILEWAVISFSRGPSQPTQESNTHLQHWQAGSLRVCHLEGPISCIITIKLPKWVNVDMITWAKLQTLFDLCHFVLSVPGSNPESHIVFINNCPVSLVSFTMWKSFRALALFFRDCGEHF